MKVDYYRFLELNRGALTDRGDQLTSFWIIQSSVEKFIMGENITPQQTELLIELGVLVESSEEIARKNIVGPFKFGNNESPQTQG